MARYIKGLLQAAFFVSLSLLVGYWMGFERGIDYAEHQAEIDIEKTELLRDAIWSWHEKHGEYPKLPEELGQFEEESKLPMTMGYERLNSKEISIYGRVYGRGRYVILFEQKGRVSMRVE